MSEYMCFQPKFPWFSCVGSFGGGGGKDIGEFTAQIVNIIEKIIK
jgi:hypothetical protein